MKLSTIFSIIVISISINFSTLAQFDFRQIDLDYYLPATEYDQSIPTPKEFLGYEVGEWHVNHDKLIAYMSLLAEKSDRISYHVYGETYEKRPLIYLTISSRENQRMMDKIKLTHQQLADPTYTEDIDLTSLPAVLFQGYSIHGDESSGSNAALLVAYHLAAGKSKEVEDILTSTVILFDPCFNPDGLQRYSAWVNANQDMMHTADPNDLSHNEPWPTGRTNHYWFDLNRDWLLLTHPESRGRIKIFQDWNPNVLTDHHEMGKNSSFFFQPGVPSRTNPLTPQLNQDLTEEIATYHMAALDSIGSDYFTKERFDDFYYGKGSTYPDGQGCVGILFEQATSEGILQETNNGLLSFPFCVRNQVVTSLSTYRSIVNMREDLLKYKRDFFRDRMKEAAADETQAYIVQQKDPWKRMQFLNILNQHNINTYLIGEDYQKEDVDFVKNESIVVPVNQKQYTMIKSIFETQTSFTDSIFYDVSTWTFPFAFDSDYKSLNLAQYESLTLKPSKRPRRTPAFGDEKSKTVIIPWDNYMSPSVYYEIQKQGSKHYRIAEEFVINKNKFVPGSIFLDTGGMSLMDYHNMLLMCHEKHIEYYEVNQSIDSFTKLGLSTMAQNNEPIQVAILTGAGVNALEAGDAWFQMDQRWKIPSARIEISNLRNMDLERYTTIIMADGRYSIDEDGKNKLMEWVEAGGELLAMRRAIDYLAKEGIVSLTNKEEKGGGETLRTSGQVIGGAMFMSQVNLKDPLFYGYPDAMVAMFKKGTQWYVPETRSEVEVVAQYIDKPLISGYASKQNLYKAPGSSSVMKMKKGEGKIIMLVDNPNFRGYWYGGATLFGNCIFNVGVE